MMTQAQKDISDVQIKNIVGYAAFDAARDAYYAEVDANGPLGATARTLAIAKSVAGGGLADEST